MEEFAEWQTYYALEPFGSPADDDRFRLLYSLHFHLGTKKGAKEPDWLDRDPEETARLRSKVTIADKMDSFLSALASRPVAPAPEEPPAI